MPVNLSYFTDRENVVVAFDELWSPERPEWILFIKGAGGTGKSLLIDYLAAEKCLTRGIPYTAYDFRGGIAEDLIVEETADNLPSRLLGFVYSCNLVLNRLLSGLTTNLSRERLDGYAVSTKAVNERLDRELVQLARQHSITVNQVIEMTNATLAHAPIQEVRVGILLDPFALEAAVRLHDDTVACLVTAFETAIDELRDRPAVIFLDTFEDMYDRADRLFPSWFHLDLLRQLHQRLPLLRVVIAAQTDCIYPALDDGKTYLTQIIDNLSADETLECLGKFMSALDQRQLKMIAAGTDGWPLLLGAIHDYWKDLAELDGTGRIADVISRSLAGEHPELRVLNLLFSRLKKAETNVEPNLSDVVRFGMILRQFNLDVLQALFSHLDSDMFEKLKSDAVVRQTNQGYTFHSTIRAYHLKNLFRESRGIARDYHKKAYDFYTVEAKAQNPAGPPHTNPRHEAIYHGFFYAQDDARRLWLGEVERAKRAWNRAKWETLLRLASCVEVQLELTHQILSLAPASIEESWGDFYYLVTENDQALSHYHSAVRYVTEFESRSVEELAGKDAREKAETLARIYTKIAFAFPPETPGALHMRQEWLDKANSVVPLDSDEIIPVRLKQAINLWQIAKRDPKAIDRQRVLDAVDEILVLIDVWQDKVGEVRLKELRAERARACDLRGNVYFDLFDKVDDAIKQHNRAVELAQELKRPDLEGIFSNNLGYDYLVTKQLGLAVEAFLRTVKVFESLAGFATPRNLAYLYSNLAEAYMALKMYKEAEEYYAKAANQFKSINNEGAYLESRFYRARARLLANMDNSLDEMDETFESLTGFYARANGSPARLVYEYYYEAMAEYYEHQNRHKDAEAARHRLKVVLKAKGFPD